MSCAWPVSDFCPIFFQSFLRTGFSGHSGTLANYFVSSLLQFGNACFNRSLGVQVFKVCSLTPDA